MNNWACQFDVLSFIDASFAADAGFSGLWSPSTSFRGQIPTAGHLLQEAIKAIGQRVIDPPYEWAVCSRSVCIASLVIKRYSVFPSKLNWRIKKIWNGKNASKGSIQKKSRNEILKTTQGIDSLQALVLWWAMQVSNLRPLQCEDSFRPLLSSMNSLS